MVLIEQIFQRVMSQGSVLARGPGGRLRNNINKTNSRNARTDDFSIGNNTTATNNVQASRSAGYARSKQQIPLGGRVGLYVAPGLLESARNNGNTENLAPFRYHRSARADARRQMAIECGLKSLPVNTRWSPTGRTKSVADGADQGPVTQNQVYLQAPDGNVSARRGLSGSKVRSTSVTPRPGSHTPRSGSLPANDQQDSTHYQQQQQQQQQLQQSPQALQPNLQHQHHLSETVGYPISPSPRPQSRKFNTRLPSAPVEGDDENGLVRHYKWNSSEQGIRLQRQLSSLSSCRSIKRASEMVSHRLDPMYLMSGSKVALQNRYGIDEHDMRRLHEMTQIREGLLSDLKKMKFPYGARAPKHVVQRTHKLRPAMEDTPRTEGGNNPAKASLDPNKTTTAHPSTPASDPADGSVTQQQQERPPSEHTEDEESVHSAATE